VRKEARQKKKKKKSWRPARWDVDAEKPRGQRLDFGKVDERANGKAETTEGTVSRDGAALGKGGRGRTETIRTPKKSALVAAEGGRGKGLH